jgi:iron(III) transport system substrate-binding protein
MKKNPSNAMNTTSKILSIFLVLLLAAVASGCTLAVEGRGTEGPPRTVRILGSAEEEYVRGMVRAFETETGHKAVYVRMSSGEALDELRTNRDAPRFTVWWGGPVDAYVAANSEGLLQPYTPRGFAKVPNRYKDADGAWTGVYVGALAIFVNTRTLAAKGLPEPTSWADLTNPIYKGQISMAHPETSGTAYTFLATILQLHGKNEEAGFNYFADLDHNVIFYERAGAAPVRIVGRGEMAIGIAFSHDVVAAIEDGFNELKLIFPSEGTGYEIGGMALIKHGPEQELGQEFMDWAMTEKAQELGPLFTAYQIPTNPDAKVPQKSVRLSSIATIDYDFQWSGAKHQTFSQRFSATISSPPEDRRLPR